MLTTKASLETFEKLSAAEALQLFEGELADGKTTYLYLFILSTYRFL